jgi:hypothetical protein
MRKAMHRGAYVKNLAAAFDKYPNLQSKRLKNCCATSMRFRKIFAPLCATMAMGMRLQHVLEDDEASET